MPTSNATARAMEKAEAKHRRSASTGQTASPATAGAGASKPSATELALAKSKKNRPANSSSSPAQSKPHALVRRDEPPSARGRSTSPTLEPVHVSPRRTSPTTQSSHPKSSRTPSPVSNNSRKAVGAVDRGQVLSKSKSRKQLPPPPAEIQHQKDFKLLRRIILTVVCAVLASFAAFIASNHLIDAPVTLALPENKQALAIQGSELVLNVLQRASLTQMMDSTGMVSFKS